MSNTERSIFDQLAEHAELPFDRARMLPLAGYRSTELLEAELAELFGRDWLCVGRTADVPDVGDYITAEVPVEDGGQRSIIVLRADDGEVRAFDNICIHRGARLLDGCGHEARITCPYHAWVYRLDGSLVGAPYMTGRDNERPFDPSAHQLRALATEVWQGFVFVNQNPAAEPLGLALAGLDEVIGRYNMAGYVPVHEQVDVWATNWKLLVENFMDAYHVFKVHQNSFGANGDSTLDTVLYPGTDRWAHHRVCESQGPDLAHPDNTSLEAEWRKTTVLAAVFPGFVVQLQPDWMWLLRITPLGTDHVRVAWQVAVAPELLADPPGKPDIAADLETKQKRYIADLLDLVNLVNSEDQPVVEALRSNAHQPQFDRGPLSYLERNVYDFDRYVSTRLGRAEGGRMR